MNRHPLAELQGLLQFKIRYMYPLNNRHRVTELQTRFNDDVPLRTL